MLNNHLLLDLIETVEDFLEVKEIKIPNKTRDDEDPESNSNIWGDDFYNMMEDFREVCEAHGIEVKDTWEGEHV